MNCWSVLSASSGEWYLVFEYLNPRKEQRPWWRALGCTCEAGESGLFACWHRALIHLLQSEG